MEARSLVRGRLVAGLVILMSETICAIRAVAGGEAIFGPRAADRLIRFLAAAPQDAATPAFPDLTPCELEILNLIPPRVDEYRDRRAPGAKPQDRAQPGFDPL
jgi:hypothetical protein